MNAEVYENIIITITMFIIYHYSFIRYQCFKYVLTAQMYREEVIDIRRLLKKEIIPVILIFTVWLLSVYVEWKMMDYGLMVWYGFIIPLICYFTARYHFNKGDKVTIYDNFIR